MALVKAARLEVVGNSYLRQCHFQCPVAGLKRRQGVRGIRLKVAWFVIQLPEVASVTTYRRTL